MIKEKTISQFIFREKIFSYAFKLVLLLGVVSIAPFFNFQAVTGTIVNAILIIALIMLGRKEAIMIGIFPSIFSIVFGILSPVVLPLIPFIIVSNIVLILTLDILRKNSYWKGVIWGSILKFLLLYFSGIILVNFFELNDLAKIIAMMFSWQQLATAFSGGIVAYAVLRILKRT